MKKEDVREFFDMCAPTWDAEMIKDDEILRRIFDNADIEEGVTVLDVACGTGVLVPYYMDRNVSQITGVDISPKMVEIAKDKYESSDVRILCQDVEDMPGDVKYDRVMVYNAFPHFPDPGRLIGKLSELVAPGGKLSIAHGMSREKIDKHHEGIAGKVSIGLISEDELAELMRPYFNIDVKISNEEMYQVSGTKK